MPASSSPPTMKMKTLSREEGRAEEVLLKAAGLEWLRDGYDVDTSPPGTRRVPLQTQTPTLDNVDAFDALVDRFLSDAAPKSVAAGTAEARVVGNLANDVVERVCTSCKRRRLRDEDFEPDRKTCRECLRKQRRRHARKVRSALEARLRRNARETTTTTTG